MKKQFHEIKRILCMLLATILTMLTVAACGAGDMNPQGTDTSTTVLEETTTEAETTEETTTEDRSEEESTTEEETTPPEPEPETYVPLIAQGVLQCCVVYPADFLDYEKAAAEELVRFLEEKSGLRPVLKTDAQPADPALLEILVGDTARTADSMKREALSYGRYALQLTKNNKLVLNGGLRESLNFAVEEVERGIARWGLQTAGTVQLPDTVLNLTYVPPISECMFIFGTKPLTQLIGNGGQSYLLYFADVSAADFSIFCNTLNENGFETVEEPRMMMDTYTNFYTMLSNGEIMATVVLTSHNEQARVFVEKIEDNGYFSYVNDNTEKICEPLFFHVGTGLLHGQCEIFRFSNGEFFIVDGGISDAHATYGYAKNGTQLISLLKKYAPDPNNIRIAGWFLTHAHEDHTGVIQYFYKNYANDPTFTVENIFYNNYSPTVIWEKESDAGWVVPLALRLERELEAYAAATGASIHKVHPGQILYFGDAKLEFIYTHEMRICASTLTSINGLSIVARFTVEGQTFLITGDTTTKSNAVMEDMYGDALRSDFYQTPHHGYGGNSTTLAGHVDPKWVLWPCNTERYTEVKVKNHNAYLFDSARNRVEAHYVAEDKTVVFSLPFDGTNCTVIDNKEFK